MGCIRCPLLMAACIVRKGEALHEEAECVKSKCAWWSDDYECLIPGMLNEIMLECGKSSAARYICGC